MKRSVVGLLVAMAIGMQGAFAQDAPLDFLERRNMTTPQDTPFEVEQTSAEVRAHNKQVVLDFYKVISDHRAWTEENRIKYFHDDFVQHDPAEPNTSEAFFNFFRTRNAEILRPEATADGDEIPRPPMMRMPGDMANDSNGSPVNWMIAEGDIVVVVRHRNWEWEGGPVPVFNGIWVDFWRLEDGKIKDQWCSCRPTDSNLPKIFQLMEEGKFPKNENWD